MRSSKASASSKRAADTGFRRASIGEYQKATPAYFSAAWRRQPFSLARGDYTKRLYSPCCKQSSTCRRRRRVITTSRLYSIDEKRGFFRHADAPDTCAALLLLAGAPDDGKKPRLRAWSASWKRRQFRAIFATKRAAKAMREMTCRDYQHTGVEKPMTGMLFPVDASAEVTIIIAAPRRARPAIGQILVF